MSEEDIQVRVIATMMPISWEDVTDAGITLPADLEAHRGHHYVAAELSILGWNFSNWLCGQCNTQAGSTQ